MATHEIELTGRAAKIVKIQYRLIISDKNSRKKQPPNPVFQKKTFKHKFFH